MTWQDILFSSVYVVLVFGIPGIVVWASYSTFGALEKIDFSELWLHKGRVDKFGVIVLGTWWIQPCSILLWTLERQIKSEDYVIYMGWALPLLVKMWAPKNGGTPTP